MVGRFQMDYVALPQSTPTVVDEALSRLGFRPARLCRTGSRVGSDYWSHRAWSSVLVGGLDAIDARRQNTAKPFDWHAFSSAGPHLSRCPAQVTNGLRRNPTICMNKLVNVTFTAHVWCLQLLRTVSFIGLRTKIYFFIANCSACFAAVMQYCIVVLYRCNYTGQDRTRPYTWIHVTNVDCRRRAFIEAWWPIKHAAECVASTRWWWLGGLCAMQYAVLFCWRAGGTIE